jgi:hypothetical protein
MKHLFHYHEIGETNGDIKDQQVTYLPYSYRQNLNTRPISVKMTAYMLLFFTGAHKKSPRYRGLLYFEFSDWLEYYSTVSS